MSGWWCCCGTPGGGCFYDCADFGCLEIQVDGVARAIGDAHVSGFACGSLTALTPAKLDATIDGFYNRTWVAGSSGDVFSPISPFDCGDVNSSDTTECLTKFLPCSTTYGDLTSDCAPMLSYLGSPGSYTFSNAGEIVFASGFSLSVFGPLIALVLDTSSGYLYANIAELAYFCQSGCGTGSPLYYLIPDTYHQFRSNSPFDCSDLSGVSSFVLSCSYLCSFSASGLGRNLSLAPSPLLDMSSATVDLVFYTVGNTAGHCVKECSIYNTGGSTNVFSLTVDTTNTSTGSSASNQFSLPLLNTGTYNFSVDWGDGSSDTITSWSDSAKTHTYASAGQYTINITGDLTGWQFNNSGDKLKPLMIENWGGTTLTINNSHAFWGCVNLDASNAAGTTATLTGNVEDTFRACTSLVSGVADLDVSGATSMQEFFEGCTLLNDDLTGWDTSNVTDFQSTFKNCDSFNSQIFGAWDFSSAIRADGLFQFANLFNNGGQSAANVNFGSATTLASILYGCPSFNQSVDNWVFASATTLSDAFRGASSFNQSLDTWDMSGVSNVSNMLRSTAFDQSLAAWDVTSVTTANGFLEGGSLSTANYDATLISWAAQSVNSGVSISFGSSTYSASGSSARTTLTTTYSWTIIDSGFVP